MLAQNASNRAAYLEEYSYQTKEDQEILHSLHRESSCQGQSLKTDTHTNPKAHNGQLSISAPPLFSQKCPTISCLFKLLCSIIDESICHSFTLNPLAFNMATDLAMDPEYQLFVSSKCYEAAYELLVSEALKDHASDQLAQVLKRLGNIRNEMGVYYMNQSAAMQTEEEGMLGSSCNS